MTSDVTLETFIDLSVKSRLLDPGQIERAIAARARTAGPKSVPPPLTSARDLADLLVRAGELTHFQAAKLLHGRWSGLVLGHYHLLAPLGRGGMGTVYIARDTRLVEEKGEEVLVAIKVLPPRVAREQERMLMRFRREIDLGTRTNHPNVARMICGGEIDGVNYIAMEYVPGKSLQRLVGQGGRLTVGDACRIFADIAAGLQHLHDIKLIHRDLKPANVIATPTGGAKILDLGLALALGEPLPDDPRIVGGKGYILGTMDFISPEQARNATDVGPHSDLYSLGCSLYFALSGTPPFPGGTSKDKIRRQRMIDPAPLTDMNSKVPTRLARIVARLMSKTPGDRPTSAAAVRELLLPFAAKPQETPVLTTRDAVGVVDTPDMYPELWTDDADQEGQATHEPSEGPMLLLQTLPEPEPSHSVDTRYWFMISGIVLGFILLGVLLLVLRSL